MFNIENDDKALMLEVCESEHDKFEPVPSLQLLCRLTIRDNVMWKDVEKLPIPQNIKRDLHIGEIPESHVIHQIIGNKTTNKV